MNVALAPFIVEGILILAAATLGFIMGRAGRPYGKVKLAFHLFFFAWLSVGYYFISAGMFSAMSPLLIPILVMGLGLAVQLVAGISMLARREAGTALPTVHKISASVMLLADVAALVITALR